MPTWESAADEIGGRISRNTGVLKIVLKTLDESVLLRGWIEHHRHIVGIENIVVADNGSTDAEVLSTYDEYSPDLLVFQYTGFHNFVHDRLRFPQLYGALAASSDYTLFLDTDERLIQVCGSRYVKDRSIVANLQSRKSRMAIPTTWLFNAPSSENVFCIGEHLDYLTNNLKWGKPIIPSSVSLPGPLIHNYQFPSQLYADPQLHVHDEPSHFFLLHLANLSSAQRLKVNRNKLIARGFADRKMTYDEIVSKLNVQSKDQTINRCVEEIRLILANGKSESGVIYSNPPPRHISVKAEGEVQFAGDAERRLLASYLNDSSSIIRDTLGNKQFDVPGVPRHDAAALLKLANEQAQKNRREETEWILRAGIDLYPAEVDQYGHPVFRKELVRLLLHSEEWERAIRMAPIEGSFGGSHWHEILFARAYSKTGNIDLAREWWNKALVADPQNGEARAAADNLGRTAMVTRAEVVQTFVNLYSDPSYLEIGVSSGSTFHAVKANRKIAVDPKFQFPPGDREVGGMTSYHEVPSDIYFGELAPPNAKFDVIFLDGVHTLEQTLRDLLSAESLLSPYGVIVIDDVIPNSYQASLRDLDNFSEVRRISGLKDSSWMGDVFRLVFFIDTFLQQFSYATVMENHGQLVLWAARRKADELQPRNLEHICRYEYCDVLRNKAVFKLTPLSEIRQLVQEHGPKKK